MASMETSDFGLSSLAVIEQNLLLNVECQGGQVFGYKRITSIMVVFVILILGISWGNLEG